MTRVKICGVTRREDAALAAALGAAAVGFVFWPGSPRSITEKAAAAIARELPPLVSTVGVFVDQPIDEVRRVAEAVRLTAVQLHGAEPLDFAAALLQPVIKAIGVTDGFEPSSLDLIPAEVTVLLDAHDPIRKGGTGRTIDWALAAAASARRPVFLSGGLHAGNVAEAVRCVRPYAVDVSSGVEASPGIKDPDKLRAFFDAIRDVHD